MTEVSTTVTTPVGTTRRVRALDVAREAGVSRAAVGFVINNTPGIAISTATRERVLEAAKKLGYRPNAAASALARGKSNIVLLILPDWPLDHMLGRHLSEAERVLDVAGLHLVTSTKHAESSARPLWEVLAPDIVVGLMPFSESELAAFREAGITRVFPSREMVVSDNPAIVRGPALQVEHLARRGHTRLAYVGSADPHLAGLSELRRNVATAVAAENGVEMFAAVDAHIESDLSDEIRNWRDAGVTGVVAFNDEMAAVVLRAARDASVDVPHGLAVVGHDDTPLARLVSPALTTVAYDASTLGELFNTLASDPRAAIDIPALVSLPQLVIRDSA